MAELSLEDRVAKLEREMAKLTGSRNHDLSSIKVDIDGKWGDPKVYRDPPMWKAQGKPSFQGMEYSKCSIEYLENLAKYLAWGGEQDDKAGKKDANGKPVGWKKRQDAAKAQAWADRKKANGESETAVDLGDDPFAERPVSLKRSRRRSRKARR